jgi:hypothetical protein
MVTGNKRMRTHILEERVILMDQVNKFATGNAHRIETRNGQMEDVSDERLYIMLEQVREIDSILNDPSTRSPD